MEGYWPLRLTGARVRARTSEYKIALETVRHVGCVHIIRFSYLAIVSHQRAHKTIPIEDPLKVKWPLANYVGWGRCVAREGEGGGATAALGTVADTDQTIQHLRLSFHVGIVIQWKKSDFMFKWNPVIFISGQLEGYNRILMTDRWFYSAVSCVI